MTDKVTLTNLANLQNEVTAVTAINANNVAITTAMDNTLSRDGTAPNQMGSTFDMNNHQIVNLPSPATINSPARLQDVVSNPTIVVPPIGTSGAAVPFLNGNNTWSGTNTFNPGIANSSLANMSANTLKGNLTSGSATPTDFTIDGLTLKASPATSDEVILWDAAGTSIKKATVSGLIAAAVPPIGAFKVLSNPTAFSAVPVSSQYGFLHSKDMGAVGNGVADDTTALQTWINTCQANNLIAFLDAGTYKITTALSVTASITIIGVNPQVSILQPITTISGINVSTGSPVFFRDFSVQYASTANVGNNAILITTTGAGNVNTESRIDRVYINNAANGIFMGQAVNWDITNCDIRNIPTSGAGILLDNTGFGNADVGDSIIQGCNINLSGNGNCITILSYAGIRILSNKLTGTNTSAQTAVNMSINPGVTASDFFFQGNSVEGVASGIIMQRQGSGTFTNVIITGNEIEHFGSGSAFLNPPDTRWLTNVCINNNVVFAPASANTVFVVRASECAAISNNTIVSNNASTAKLSTTGSNNVVAGPNQGSGTFVASDLAATNITVFNPT